MQPALLRSKASRPPRLSGGTVAGSGAARKCRTTGASLFGVIVKVETVFDDCDGVSGQLVERIRFESYIVFENMLR